jgi:sugar lactone lactonase YvrE
MVRIRFATVGLLVLALLSVSTGVTAAAPGQDFQKVIALPNGFGPEGVAMGRGTTIYAGSIATGAIYQADVRTGEGRLLVAPPSGRAALGLEFDVRTGYLFVAGGPTGDGYVYDTKTGQTVGVFELTSATPTFINDVVVTGKAAYFTDSSRPVLYRLPLQPGGGLSDAGAVTEIPLGGDFEFVPGQFNANGIEASPSGDALLVDNTVIGTLYRVDPATGVATVIPLQGGAATSGDGLLLIGHTLYIAQNFLNQITVIRLNAKLSSGEVVEVLTDDDLDIPSTLTSFGGSLYAVNARFTTPATPETPYWITQLLG